MATTFRDPGGPTIRPEDVEHEDLGLAADVAIVVSIALRELPAVHRARAATGWGYKPATIDIERALGAAHRLITIDPVRESRW